MTEIDCGTCPQLGRPRSHLGLVYAETDQAGHDGNRFQTYDCLRRLTGSRRPPFRVLGHPEVGGIGVYMHENAASHVHDNTFEQCEASQKKKSSQERAPQSRRAPEEVLLAVLGAHPSLTPSGHARRCDCRGPLQVAAEEAPGLDSAPQLPWPGVGLSARKLQRRAGATEKK